MADEDLDAVADRLYALPPEEFTAARDAAARATADKALRAAVKALRRPSASAWVVDVLARERPELLEQLLALGPALARAQRDGQGDALRELGQQRRELVAAVSAAAVELVGRAVTGQVRAEVEQTLEAALADPAGAQAVRSGRLVRALSFAGFGGVDLDGAVAVPVRRSIPPAQTGAASAGEADGGRAARRRTDAVARAEQDRAEAVGRAEQDRAEAVGRAAQARAEAVGRAEAAALHAAAALDDAVRAAQSAAHVRDEAEAAAQRADDATSAAEQAVRDLEARLADARRAAQDAARARAAAAHAQERAERAAVRRREGVEAAQTAAEAARTELDRLCRG